MFQRRRRRLTPPLADGDIYHTPYGAHLPPYSEVNPHKDFSPPDYENISIVCMDNPAFSTDSAGSWAACLECEDPPPHVHTRFHSLRLEITTGNDDGPAQAPSVTSSDDVGGQPCTPQRYSFSAEMHHNHSHSGSSCSSSESPKRGEVYRATYVTWI